MTTDVDGGAAVSSRLRSGTPDRTDRILVIAAVALWLTALGAAVAAVVALVDLGSAHTGNGSGGSETPWLLYSVIGVSALVIVGAIPLLLKARQSAATGAPLRSDAPADGRARETPSVAQRLQPFGAPVLRRHSTPPAGHRVGFPTAAVEQIWLRCTASLAASMGAAATGVGVATYLMASEHETASWIVYVVAGLITVGMIAVPWVFLRQLHAVLESAG